MALFLQTDTNPGDAEWGPAPSGGGDSLVEIITLNSAGAAPAIDPDGRTNLCYLLEYASGGSTLELPEITPTLPALWRITVGSSNGDALQFIEVSAAAGNTIANVSGDVALITQTLDGGSGDNIPAAFAIFVHDGVSQWVVYQTWHGSE